ncbi:PREDICTED: protein PFC0760c-like [Wasmannia auropunctata]|uniref:protein PFC0760c-like n=1 Tax=Wasmannia auropunctata TaxID=64793 RepID=UPI0005EF2FBC|nr:PREDICTED: protein PFC0760c-like [Wasmannia auropunctata]
MPKRTRDQRRNDETNDDIDDHAEDHLHDNDIINQDQIDRYDDDDNCESRANQFNFNADNDDNNPGRENDNDRENLARLNDYYRLPLDSGDESVENEPAMNEIMENDTDSQPAENNHFDDGIYDNNNVDNNDDEEQQKLYDGARITRRESEFLIMSFFFKIFSSR